MGHRGQKLGAWLLLAALLLSCRSALAVKVLTPKKTDYTERLAKARQAIRERKVGSYGMVPIYGRDIEDGTWPIEVRSNSQYFKIASCQLTVKGDEMNLRPFHIDFGKCVYIDIRVIGCCFRCCLSGCLFTFRRRRRIIISCFAAAVSAGYY